MGDIRIVMTLDEKGVVKKTQELDKALAELGRTAQTTGGRASSFGSDLTSKLIPSFTAATLAADLVRKTVGGVNDFLKSSITEALESEQAQHRLATALELTGRGSQFALASLIQFSQAEAQATLYSDEQIQSVTTLLAQMTRLDEAGLKRATRGAMGLASVLGMDLQSAGMMVTKAMEGNFQALQRVGITVDDTLPKHEQLVQVLEKLVALYPRATAELETTGGKISKLRQNWRELKEGIGSVLLEATAAKDTIPLLNDVVKGLNNTMADGEKKAKDFAAAANAARGLITPMAYATRQAAEDTKELDAQIRAIAEDFESSIRPVSELGYEFKDFSGAVRRAAAALKEMDALKKAWDKTLNQIDIGPLYDLLELDVGEVVSGLFPTDKMAEIPPYLQAIIDSCGGVQVASNDMSGVWDSALGTMLSSAIAFGDGTGSVFKAIGDNYANMVKSAITAMEMMIAKEILFSKKSIFAKQMEATAAYIADAFKKLGIFAIPVAAAGFAVVNALFSKLLKFEKGAYFPGATMLPAHVVGEGGPEFYLPERHLERTMERTIERVTERGGAGGGTVVQFGPGSIVVNSRGEDGQITARRIIEAVNAQLRLHGRPPLTRG